MSQSKKYDDLMVFLKARRSIRKYGVSPIPTQDIEKMVAAAAAAPSAGNSQNWKFVAVVDVSVKSALGKAVEKKVADIVARINTDEDRRRFISYSKYYTFFAAAPVVIAVIAARYDSSARRIMRAHGIEPDIYSSAAIQGPAAAIENLLLAASALGYGACWMTGPLIAGKKLSEILGIAPPDELLALIPVGEIAESPPPARRAPVSEKFKII